MYRQMDRWTNEGTDGQTDRQTDGWTTDQVETFVNEMLTTYSFSHHHNSSLNSVTK